MLWLSSIKGDIMMFSTKKNASDQWLNNHMLLESKQVRKVLGLENVMLPRKSQKDENENGNWLV